MSLTGVWVNEHKSVMVMSEDSDGNLGGTFRSLVGRDARKRPLVGRASSEEAGKQLLGFTVCFDIANPVEGIGHHSLCAWSGWATANEIITNWLLISSILDGSGFFQRCLAQSRGSTPGARKLWREGIYDQIREMMPMQGSMSIERMCQLAEVSRAGFYRSLRERTPAE